MSAIALSCSENPHCGHATSSVAVPRLAHPRPCFTGLPALQDTIDAEPADGSSQTRRETALDGARLTARMYVQSHVQSYEL